MTQEHHGSLVRHIGLGHGIALYVSAILGAGVLVLPGQVASLAGPASLLSWGLACAIGVPLACMFAALGRRFPDAGGVATYVTRAFGPAAGGVTGWLYFVAGAVGQTIVPLTGGYYVADALRVDEAWAYGIAALILAVGIVANLTGHKVGAAAQLALAAGVALALIVAIVVAVPSMSTARLSPFAPHGIAPIGSAVIVLFFAFAGWEAVAHLAGEFTDPERNIRRAVAATIGIVTVLYLGTASAVVLTGTFGGDHTDHVAVSLLVARAFGSNAQNAAAFVAVIICLGTTNAFIAGISRLGYSLARSGWMPRPIARLTPGSVPVGGVLTVGVIALGGLALAAACRWGTETLIVVPSTLVAAVYLLSAAAGTRLLRRTGRACAVLTLVPTLLVAPAAARNVLIPLVVVALALCCRYLLLRGAADHPRPARPPRA